MAGRGVILGSTAALLGTGVFTWWYRARIITWINAVLRRDKGSVIEEEDTSPRLPPHIQREIRKEEKRQRLLPLLTMTKPMYDNILMQDSQGNPLATISLKKANWYINKGLADWLDQCPEDCSSNPPACPSILRLRFQPQNRIHSQDNLFNISTKANQCVVCGHGEHCNRHYVSRCASLTTTIDL